MIIMLVIGILPLLYLYVFTVYNSTLRAMGGAALKITARFFGFLFTLGGLMGLLTQ